MNRPLFAVGEIVVLQSKTFPELNGEYEVIFVAGPGEDVTICGGKTVNGSRTTGYGLGVIAPNGKDFWCESALRKRHQPSEYSFDGLKQILAMPVSRGDFA